MMPLYVILLLSVAVTVSTLLLTRMRLNLSQQTRNVLLALAVLCTLANGIGQLVLGVSAPTANPGDAGLLRALAAGLVVMNIVGCVRIVAHLRMQARRVGTQGGR